MTYALAHAKEHLDALIDQALAGELVIIEVTDGVGVQLLPIDPALHHPVSPDA